MEPIDDLEAKKLEWVQHLKSKNYNWNGGTPYYDDIEKEISDMIDSITSSYVTDKDDESTVPTTTPKSNVEIPLTSVHWDMLGELKRIYVISDAPFKIEMRRINVIRSNRYYYETDKEFLNEQRKYFLTLQRCKDAKYKGKLTERSPNRFLHFFKER